MTVELDVGLLPDARAPARARRAVRTLRGVVPDADLADLELLVSELVTNAVQHPSAVSGEREWIRLLVAARRDKIRVDVTDRGQDAGALIVRDPLDGHVSGWGLVFVDRLASRWGVDEEDGTRVWFELDRSAPSTVASRGGLPGVGVG
ncbi:MAG: ATP-binding protein [Actinomycetota bacterium]